MDNLGFRGDGKVSVQRDSDRDDVCNGVKSLVVKEVVKEEPVPEEGCKSNNGDQKNDDNDELRKTDIPENSKTSPRLNTGVISRKFLTHYLNLRNLYPRCIK